MKLVLLLVVIIVGGCGDKVVQKPKPIAECTDCDVPIATHTKVVVNTSWSGLCEHEYGFGAGYAIGPVSPNISTCKEVEHEIRIECMNDACQWSPNGSNSYFVTPTKPGPLEVSVVMTPKSGKAKTVKLPVLQVFEPTKMVARCTLAKDGVAQVVVELFADTTRLRSVGKSVRVRGGDSCAHSDDSYRCKIASSEPVEIEAVTPSKTLVESVSCAPAS